VSERAVPGQHLFLTRAELEPTLADYHKAGQPTEAGALSILMNRLIKKGAVQIINARPKLGRSRLDTEDTGLCAAQLLQGKSLENFRLVIVSHACFQGQKEQILSGFLRAGIHLRKEQVEFYGSGYPAERVRNSAAYTQILVSSLAERVYSTMKYLEMEKACAFQEAL
jgi:hypothetical protein